MPQMATARHDHLGHLQRSTSRSGTFWASRSACRSGGCSAAASWSACRPMPPAAGRLPRTIGEQLNSYIDQGGFKAVKMRVGAMDGAPHISAARVKAARKAIGPGHRARWSTRMAPTPSPSAKRFVHMVERLRPRLVRGAGHRRRQARHGRGARGAATCRSPPARARRRDSPSATSPMLQGRRHLPARPRLLRRHFRGDEASAPSPAPSI